MSRNTHNVRTCLNGKIWKECGSSCARTCTGRGHVMCLDWCVPGCFCPPSTPVEHNGECISQDQCPSTTTPYSSTTPYSTATTPSSATATTPYSTTTSTRPEITATSSRQQPRFASHTLNINITQEMSPRMRLLVYYVFPGGEIVADSIVVKVAKVIKNQVRASIRIFVFFLFSKLRHTKTNLFSLFSFK